jgi:hypothetical protein
MNKTRIPTVTALNLWQERLHGLFILWNKNPKLKVVDDPLDKSYAVVQEIGTERVLGQLEHSWLPEFINNIQPQEAYEMVFAIKRLINLLMAARLEIPLDSRLGWQIDEVLSAIYGDSESNKSWDDMEHYRNQSLNIKDYKIKASQ